MAPTSTGGRSQQVGSMDRQGDGRKDPDAHGRAVARLTTLQRLRDDALAKNRKSMLRTIEDMIASELRALQVQRDPGGKPDGKS